MDAENFKNLKPAAPVRNEYDKATVFDTAGLVQYAEGSIVSRAIMNKEIGTVTLFAFDKGQLLSEHTAPFDAMISVTDGQARITIGGEPHDLSQGQAIVMPANVPHAVYATEKFKMMLTMIKSK